jgi:hypothetical protein
MMILAWKRIPPIAKSQTWEITNYEFQIANQGQRGRVSGQVSSICVVLAVNQHEQSLQNPAALCSHLAHAVRRAAMTVDGASPCRVANFTNPTTP